MSYPKLITKSKYTILPQSFNDTVYDNVLKEPIGEMRFAEPIVISGQIKLTEYYTYGKGKKDTHAGRQEDSAGYIMFRYIDASKLGWKPRIGDKITHFYTDSFAEVEMNVYITQIRNAVHKYGIPVMFRAYYETRSPALQTTVKVRYEE